MGFTCSRDHQLCLESCHNWKTSLFLVASIIIQLTFMTSVILRINVIQPSFSVGRQLQTTLSLLSSSQPSLRQLLSNASRFRGQSFAVLIYQQNSCKPTITFNLCLLIALFLSLDVGVTLWSHYSGLPLRHMYSVYIECQLSVKFKTGLRLTAVTCSNQLHSC